jgi:two-component system response regulator DevR
MSIHRAQQDIGEGRRNGSAYGAAADGPARRKNHGARPQTAVILDRAPIWLREIERVLERLEIEVVGRASSPGPGLALLVETQPDLLVTETETGDPEVDGIAFLSAARSHVPGLRTIVLSGSGDREDIDSAFAAGACAYVLKTTHPHDFAMAIRQLFERSIHFAHDGAVPPAQPRPQRLTRSETEILRAVADGRTNAEIAQTLWVTTSTVKFHLGNIYRKLGVPNRTSAARAASALGLLEESGRGNHLSRPES